METKDLKKYMSDVLGRERALYTAKQIHNDIQHHKNSVLVMHESVVMPTRPKDCVGYTGSFGEAWDIVLVIGFIITIICGIIGLIFREFVFIFVALILALVCGVLYVVLRINTASKTNNFNKKKESDFQFDYDRKKKQLENIQTQQSTLLLVLGNKETEITNIINETQSTLDALYSLDIIFGKYRYFVAVASLCEYLQSGRCSTLEGHEGAYNIYENELRQNIIIGQLSTVIKELQQIRNAQYMLYEAINESNRIQQNVLSELNSINHNVTTSSQMGINNMNDLRMSIDSSAKSSAMTAYFAKESANNSRMLVEINRGDYGQLYDKKGNIVY